MRLAVDIDPVTKQLFEPLVFQLIHWFTKNATFENVETMALLDAIVDAVSNNTDGALRDLAAKALSEFFVWSIKQSTTKVPLMCVFLIVYVYGIVNCIVL